jgi:tungstate transport system ATP-binding protein
MVFQRPVLLRRSVPANLRHALAVRGVPRVTARLVALDALRAAGLAGQARQPARTLSGGEQQRLAIARASALKPKCCCSTNLPPTSIPEATRAIEELILAVEADGTRIMMTTHDIGQARRLATEVLFLHQGRLLEHSARSALLQHAPTHPAAARFIGGALLA